MAKGSAFYPSLLMPRLVSPGSLLLRCRPDILYPRALCYLAWTSPDVCTPGSLAFLGRNFSACHFSVTFLGILFKWKVRGQEILLTGRTLA